MLSMLFFLVLAALTHAQVQKIGRFAPYGFSKSTPFPDVVLQTPFLDNDELLKAAIAAEQPDPITRIRPAGPHKFAEAIDFHIDMAEPEHGQWIEDNTNNRRTWRTLIKSEGALSISLLFSDFHLPEGSEFYVIGQDDVLGAFTAEINNKVNRKFATTPLAGDSVIIEYHEPISQNPQKSGNPPAIRVSKVVHGFRATPFAYGASGHCHIDAMCRKNSKTVSIHAIKKTPFLTLSLLLD